MIFPMLKPLCETLLLQPGGRSFLMDVGDNTGGGSPADSTILLAGILRQGVRNILVVLYDPDRSKPVCAQASDQTWSWL